MSRNSTLLSLALVVYYLVIIAQVRSTLQTVTFFENSFCDGGKNESLFQTTTNLNQTWFRNASSFRVVGLWKVGLVRARENLDPDERYFYVDKSLPPDGECVLRPGWDFPGQFLFNFVERIGLSGEMTNSEITFYTDEFFTGLRFKVSDDMEKVGPHPLGITSCMHLSNETWTIYPEENFGGEPYYMEPIPVLQENLTNLYPVTDWYSYMERKTIIVGSVKRGDQRENSATVVEKLPMIFILISAGFISIIC